MGQIKIDKPSSGVIRNDKPFGLSWNANISNFVFLDDKTIRVGEPIGLLLALTYPETVNFKGQRM